MTQNSSAVERIAHAALIDDGRLPDHAVGVDHGLDFNHEVLGVSRTGRKIPAERVDDAVRRILRVKALAGLFARPPPAERADAAHFERLGSARTLRTDARLIAATNRDLKTIVTEQKFRSNLY